MKRFRYKKHKNKILLLIIILTIFNIYIINIKITPKLSDIASKSIDTYNNHLIMNFISNETLSTYKLNELINYIKNNNNEIIAINYDVEKSYKVLKNITNELYNIVSNTSYKDIVDFEYDIKDDLIIYYPIGLASDFIYLNNLGPKIPVKIKFLSSLVTGLNTKVTNYGINNVLVEIYLKIDITDNIVIPFKKDDIKNTYDVLLSSKIVMGKVPSYLGNTIENASPLLQN